MKRHEVRALTIDDVKDIEQKLREVERLLEPWARDFYLGKALTRTSDARYLVEKVRRRWEEDNAKNLSA